jgi:hypothetical protein
MKRNEMNGLEIFGVALAAAGLFDTAHSPFNLLLLASAGFLCILGFAELRQKG